MCNFIIRPIKCYATVDISLETYEDTQEPNIKCGDAVTVKSIASDGVVATDGNGTYFIIPMSVFTHSFSDKDPNAKKDSKEPTQPKQ